MLYRSRVGAPYMFCNTVFLSLKNADNEGWVGAID